ncbi:penicillin acylase family protein [Nakamurella leprariae]|uniref:Penicillin acylase family protein n=1 Tax=Nakamurella leprariae TaxID=2803911 RepID=A0A938YAM7_9ACTN|nr:penicillin acylase family protein [Nakamurella leprariae]MBM9466116.1 penicillin acylase family protein [Nakamurella leprariae]
MPQEYDLEYPVAGLTAEVEIVVDTWGVPHITAASQQDVYVAQGFNAARDRLFQIDLWRRRGNGLLSEVFGPAFVEQDRASRLLRYRGDLRAEWLAYGTATRRIVTAFTTGVNAYVRWVLDHPEAMPPEFGVHGHRPAFWAPEDVVRFRTHGLFSNAEHELARGLAVRDFGEEVAEVRHVREPADPFVLPDAQALVGLSDEVLRVYRLAFSPVDFTGAGPRPGEPQQQLSGSNNWVIAGDRTTTGRPILANDPHRAVGLPSLRYLAHLRAPGLDVIGAGEPGLPGISIGHNERVAFGLTIWSADHEDLVVHELDPADPGRYRYRGDWVSFERETATIDVAGADPTDVELEYSVLGPVLFRDAERGIAVALRAVWLQPGMSPYLASLEYQDAADADGFVQALSRWGAPGVNQVYATVDGDIGWQASALIPRRVGYDSSVPVPGDGRFDWDGFAQLDELPGVRNPACGWFASANQMNLPEDRDPGLPVTYDWYSSARYERLAAWLGAGDPISVQDSLRMQWDCVSVHALRIIAALAAVPADGVRDADVLAALRAWDGVETVDSTEALVFEIWLRRHLRPALVARLLDREGVPTELRERATAMLLRDESMDSDLRGDLRMLASFDAGSAAEVTDLTAIVDGSLRSALGEIEQRLGTDRTGWRWGALHHTRLVNTALAGRDGTDGVDPAWVQVGPAPRAGSGDTVGMTGYGPDFRQTIGSTFRMVLDVGNWDASRAVNAPGQSGDPRSPHYTDLFDTWAAGGSFPLVYSQEAVAAHAATRIRLVPHD